MIVTPFGDLVYGSDAGLQEWLQAHDQRHNVTQQQISLTYKAPLTQYDLTGQVDDNWLFMHSTMHMSLLRFLPPDQTISATLLDMQWTSADNFYAFHQMHNNFHERLDRLLGIQ